MTLPDTGEILTPIDDPCQFNPAWRAIVAGYLFSSGVRTDDDLRSISKTGCIEVSRIAHVVIDPEEESPAEKARDASDDEKDEPDADGVDLKGVVDGPTVGADVDGHDDDPDAGVKNDAPMRFKDVVKKAHVRIEPFYGHPLYRPFASDKWVSAHIKMMDEVSRGELSDASVPFRLASKWYGEMECEMAMRKRLEPLLLTEIGMDVITLDVIGTPSAQPAVEAYEKMYFNCRDDNFDRHPSMQLIQRMAMPYGPLKMFCRKGEELDRDGFVIGDGRPIAKDSDVWRAVAATMGYETLMYLWRWDATAHGLKDRSISRMIEISWNVAVSRLMSDLYTGQIAHEDAARVLASYTAHTKMLVDSRRGGGSESNDTTKALMAVLYQTSPHMIAMDESDDAVSSRNADIQSRISSQLAISKQTIEDRGEAAEHEVIDAQISDAVKIQQ